MTNFPYLISGYFTDKIAWLYRISDGATGWDSINPSDNDFTPFLNIMNEWYAKDTSNKIRAMFKSRMQDGKRCSGAVPYGYKRVDGDKQTLYIDDEAAAVVRRIFD